MSKLRGECYKRDQPKTLIVGLLNWANQAWLKWLNLTGPVWLLVISKKIWPASFHKLPKIILASRPMVNTSSPRKPPSSTLQWRLISASICIISSLRMSKKEANSRLLTRSKGIDLSLMNDCQEPQWIHTTKEPQGCNNERRNQLRCIWRCRSLLFPHQRCSLAPSNWASMSISFRINCGRIWRTAASFRS